MILDMPAHLLPLGAETAVAKGKHIMKLYDAIEAQPFAAPKTKLPNWSRPWSEKWWPDSHDGTPRIGQFFLVFNRAQQ
jgi:hypothetical protein